MEYFIAKRLLKSNQRTKLLIRSIISIAVISIVLAVSINLLTIFIIKGFQTQVREKITGFGSHILIFSATEQSIFEANPILKKQAFLSEIKKINGVKNITPVAYKPVLFQSEKTKRIAQFYSQKDTSIVEQNIHGAILKGVDGQYDWSFFQPYIIHGEIPKFYENKISDEIVISKKIATELNFKVGDSIKAYFVRSKPILKRLIVKGIYNTGLEEYDKQIAIADLKLVQELNDWGIQTSIDIEDSVYRITGFQDQLIIKSNVRGGQGQLRYDWGNGYELYGAKLLNIERDTTIQLIVSDFATHFISEKSISIEDTARLKITVQGNIHADNIFETQDDVLIKNFLNDNGTKYTIRSGEKIINVELEPGKGSQNNYIAGFELNVNNWKRLEEIQRKVHEKVAFVPTASNEILAVRSIKETENDIFTWLDFLDINVAIILTLMILIGIINMGSTLLVLILMRTHFIGILKTLGSTNWSVQKIFLTQATYFILRGMFIGNVLGLGLAAVQYYFNIVRLNAEVYYINTVPIEWNWTFWLLLNVGTLIVCVVSLIVPSRIIAKMNPAKSVRF